MLELELLCYVRTAAHLYTYKATTPIARHGAYSTAPPRKCLRWRHRSYFYFYSAVYCSSRDVGYHAVSYNSTRAHACKYSRKLYLAYAV